MACDKSKLKQINENTKAVVIGLGASGRAAIRLLRHLKAKVRVLELNPEKVSDEVRNYLTSEGIQLVGGEHKPEHFLGADIIIPSPGAPINVIQPLLPRTNTPEIIAETELAARFIKDEPIIVFTGTSGKTTTTSLASAMLEEHGFSVFTGGNIGTPLSEYILKRELEGKKSDIIVLELSSFQLQACHTLKPKVATLLNISENHLDHHADMQEYIEAKMRAFRCQEEDDIAIIGASLKNLVERYNLQGQKFFFNGDTNDFNESNLFGKHNVLNAEAAYKSTKIFGVTLKEAQEVLKKFQPIEHRLEKVLEHNNVLFVNDSKGTTVESLKVALNAFDRPILLLVGGKFKGGDLEGLLPIMKEKVKKVCMFGASRQYFEKAWAGKVELDYRETLSEAMNFLYENASSNDVVLLSPATSSFDQYPSYIARGKDFKKIAIEISKK